MSRAQKLQSTGPKTLTGSREAKQQAAVLLEVLSGARGPQDGAAALGVSLSRYYALETRALQGIVAALEPRPRGRGPRAETVLEALRQDKQRLERELGRNQALLRAAQRALGVAAPAVPQRGKLSAKDGKPGRRRRRVSRAAHAVAALRAGAEPAALPPDAAEDRS